MNASCVPPEVPVVVEHAPAAVYFVNGVHRVDHLGNGNMMITYFRNETLSDGHGQIVHSIEVKLVMHAYDLMIARRLTAAALEQEFLQHDIRPMLIM